MSIDVQQPKAYDLVGNDILIGGTAGGAFEANFNYRVHEGHDEVTGFFMAGDGVGGHSQFQLSVDVSGASFTLPGCSSRSSTSRRRTARNWTRWSCP